jgi:hypothetical protein
MSLRLSTALRNALASKSVGPHAFLVGATGDFVDGGGGNDSITDSNNSLVTAGFQIGDWITTFDPTTGNNVFSAKLLAVAAGSMEFITNTVDTVEVFKAGTAVAAAKGGSLNDIFKHGVLHIYSGTQPADADQTEGAGTKLLEISEDGTAHVPATGEYGLEFEDDAVGGSLSKLSTQSWEDDGLADGEAAWFRFYAQDVATGLDSGSPFTKIRFDGSVGLSGAQLNVASQSISTGVAFVINSFNLIVPAS